MIDIEIDIEYDAEGENSSSANNGATNGEHNTEEENSFLANKGQYVHTYVTGEVDNLRK